MLRLLWSRLVPAAVLAVGLLGLNHPARSQEIRLMSWYFGEEPANTSLRTLMKQYEDKHPGVKIVADAVTSAQRVEKFSTMMQGNQGPDLYMETNSNVRAIAARGYCADMDQAFPSEIKEVKS